MKIENLERASTIYDEFIEKAFDMVIEEIKIYERCLQAGKTKDELKDFADFIKKSLGELSGMAGDPYEWVEGNDTETGDRVSFIGLYSGQEQHGDEIRDIHTNITGNLAQEER